ncbi:LLM class flavin-dependent oxidoreductase [Dactylosporangium fulvum]|uniref:LLM class flavin-dependent oxidoreductase n=1 Tax=Dactylosporangium fulvum TaxID=53359 RepID=A0ABY5W6N3_9ACTN|nr:LLM class flavin-dependent oxidoreductase [Dactylosporangium fulvum]UWP85025.1 LLM class flavin-dependent oxidoreductase [Dactylosporangium fulvum]
MSEPVYHWFLPTGGDDHAVGAGSHGGIIGAQDTAPLPRSATHREPTLDYLTQIARAADQLGYAGVLTPTGAHCEDAWLTTAALIAATRRLRYLVAFRPGLIAPVLAAQMAATFQRLSGGRLLLNVVIGSSAAEQRGYGDPFDHDARYERAAEFLDVVRKAWTGEQFDHRGAHYDIEGGLLREPPARIPTVYLGGSSPAAVRLAAQHADVYLTWGEPVELVAEKVAKVRAEADGRELRFGIRLHVITRDTADRAWDDAERLIAGLDDDTIRQRQASLRQLESVGQRRMLDLHGGDRDRLVVAPNLWAGIGLVRGGAGTALVGSHAEVAARIAEYRAAGIDEFILSGYPHLEEAYAFAEGVMQGRHE